MWIVFFRCSHDMFDIVHEITNRCLVVSGEAWWWGPARRVAERPENKSIWIFAGVKVIGLDRMRNQTNTSCTLTIVFEIIAPASDFRTSYVGPSSCCGTRRQSLSGTLILREVGPCQQEVCVDPQDVT